MEPNNLPSAASLSDLPPFRTVMDGTQEAMPTDGAAHPADEAPEDRKKRLKRERDKRYRERKASDGSERPPDAPGGAGSPPKPPGGPSPVQQTINDLKSRFAQAPGVGDAPPSPTPGAPGSPTFVATGDVLLGMSNAVIPGLVARFASKGRVKPVDPDAVRLSPEQVKMLKPAAAPAEAYLLQNLHPVVVFGLSLLGAFTANIPPPTEEDKRAKAEAREKRKARAL